MSNYFSDFSPSQDSFEPIEEGLYRSSNTGDKVYLVREGRKYWITSPEVLKELGFEIGQEKVLNNLSTIQSGEPIRMLNVADFRTSPKASESQNTTEEAEGEVVLSAHEEQGEIHTIIEGLTSIIIPALFNSYQMFHLTGDCIGNIREYTNKGRTPYEIILIINGKTGIKIDLDKTYCDKVIENEENLGYAKAINQGIRVSQGEYIVLMNNDIKVYSHWLEDFIEASIYADLVVATPMYSRDEPWKRAVEARILREQQVGLKVEETLSDFEDFSCVFVKRAVFDGIGLFDEQFFYSCEDIDFKRRMKEKGLVYKSSKRVNVHHVGSATDIDDKPEIMNESKEKFEKKWGDQDSLL